MTVNLERIFLTYILKNKKYFVHIEPHYFRNADISFVYSIVKKYLQKNSDTDVPSIQQIFEMVKLEDNDNTITKELFKAMLNVNLASYNEDSFIKPKMNAWILGNRIQDGANDIIDETRNLDNISDYEEMISVANKMKEKILEASNTKFDSDDSLGIDFDDPESHIQDIQANKVKTGWESMDSVLGGGWDRGTFNCIMGMTNAGKSLWMQNFAVNSANEGYNVLYITLEMSEKKCMKRMGSMRLKIPINDYDTRSKDIEFIKKRIDKLHNGSDSSIFGDRKMGKILSKFYAAGTSTVDDFDNLIEKIHEKKGIKIDLIVVDYISLIAPAKGLHLEGNLYMKGKNIAEGLRALAAKYNCPLITGIQVSKDAWSASDVTLDKIPESKAIAETADTFFAIIRTEEMKRNNVYRLKLLKQRDGDFSRSLIKFDLDPTTLSIEGDMFVDAIL